MANTMTGRVIEVRPVQTLQTKSGQAFSKRELILDCARFDPYTGERMGFDNTPCFTFVNDKCSMLDGVAPGQVVTVYFDINGRKSADKDTYYNDVRGYKIDVRQQVSPAPQQAAIHPSVPPGQPLAAAPYLAQPYQQPVPQYPQYPQQAQQYPQADQPFYGGSDKVPF